MEFYIAVILFYMLPLLTMVGSMLFATMFVIWSHRVIYPPSGRMIIERLFAWILLIPLFTVPAQWGQLGVLALMFCQPEALGSDEVLYRCPPVLMQLTLWPGLLNLSPFLWLSDARRRVRYAALLAGSLGAARILVPAMLYTSNDALVIIPDYLEPIRVAGPAVGASVRLWFLSVFLAAAFPLWVRKFSDE